MRAGLRALPPLPAARIRPRAVARASIRRRTLPARRTLPCWRSARPRPRGRTARRCLGQALRALADGGDVARHRAVCQRGRVREAVHAVQPGTGAGRFFLQLEGGAQVGESCSSWSRRRRRACSGRPRRASQRASAANSGRAVQSMRKPVEKIRKSSANSPLGVVTRISSSISARSRTPQPRLKRAFGWRDTQRAAAAAAPGRR